MSTHQKADMVLAIILLILLLFYAEVWLPWKTKQARERLEYEKRIRLEGRRRTDWDASNDDLEMEWPHWDSSGSHFGSASGSPSSE